MTSNRPPARTFAGILVCGGLLFGALCGCAPKSMDATAAPAATTDQYATFKESITKSKPGSMVGQVLTTYMQYAAVTDIPVKELKAGTTVTFVDSTGATVGNGTVVEPSGDSAYLQVKFDSTGKRPVQKGDFAVYLKD